jgi:hypothetical protein
VARGHNNGDVEAMTGLQVIVVAWVAVGLAHEHNDVTQV